MTGLDPDDRAAVSQAFGIAEAMAAEIVHENDGEWRWDNETPEQRWTRMRAWVESHIADGATA